MNLDNFRHQKSFRIGIGVIQKLFFTIVPMFQEGYAKAMGNCTARQCSPLRRKFMECSINSPALSLLI